MSIIVITAPTDTPSSARPRALDDAPVCDLIAGMRTTQPHEEEAVEGEEHGDGGAETEQRGCGAVFAGSPEKAVRTLFRFGTKEG